MNLKYSFLTTIIIPLSFVTAVPQTQNSIPEKHHIEKIEVRVSPGEAGDNFDLHIFEDRHAVYTNYIERYPKFYNRIPQHSATIDSTNYNQLLALLSRIEFTKLEQPDSVEESLTQDNSQCILKITYDKGKIKTIKDYRSDGSKDMRELYTLLLKFPKNQPWQIIYQGDVIGNDYHPALQTK